MWRQLEAYSNHMSILYRSATSHLQLVNMTNARLVESFNHNNTHSLHPKEVFTLHFSSDKEQQLVVEESFEFQTEGRLTFIRHSSKAEREK